MPGGRSPKRGRGRLRRRCATPRAEPRWSCPAPKASARSEVDAPLGDLSCLMETGWHDADRVAVLHGKLLRRHADALDVLTVLAQITRDLVGGGVLRIDL